MTMEFVNIPVDMQLEVHQTTQGTTAIITPVTLIPAGMEVLRNRNDLWHLDIQTIKDTWWERRDHNAKHSSCQTNCVQFQQKGWRTIEEQL